MLLGGLDAESRGLESLNPSGKNYDWWGCGNLEDSGPGADLRCAPARAGPPSEGAGATEGVGFIRGLET